jgi:hypothetical protein
MVALTTIIVNNGSELFCRILGVDCLPSNSEVAARSPPLVVCRTDTRNGQACVGFIDPNRRDPRRSEVFEVVRVSFLLANERFVVCERGCEPAEEEEFAPARSLPTMPTWCRPASIGRPAREAAKDRQGVV